MVSLTVIVCVISLKLHHTTTENAKEMPKWVNMIKTYLEGGIDMKGKFILKGNLETIIS